MKEITIPEKLVPLVKAFSADDQSAKLLIIEAAKAICKTEQHSYGLPKDELYETELEGIIAFMQGLNPLDTLEMIYAAQIISSHIIGLRMLGNNFAPDQVLGLKLLRFSNKAMARLQKKRSEGISQNIDIKYTHSGSGSALMQTTISGDQSCL